MVRSKLLVVFALILLVVAGCVGCSDRWGKPTQGNNIIMIVIDTLRWDHMGIYGYHRNVTPNIDKLAKEAVVFDNAYSHAPWTVPSIASMFTSLNPRRHGIRQWGQGLEEKFITLAEQLKAHGYHTEAYASHIVFEPKFNFHQGFDVFDISVLNKGPSKYISTSREITDLAIKSLSKPMSEPYFLWLHYFDPHNMYMPHNGFIYGFEEVDKYDSEIAYTDHHIGRLLKWLEQNQKMKNTIITIIADHGEEFMEHGHVFHTKTLYEELVHIPWIIKVPGFRPKREERTVAETDLAPTLLDLVGVPIPEQFEGLKLPYNREGFAITTTNRPVYMETYRAAQKIGVKQGNYKLINDLKNKKGELYDLATDPKEKKNIHKAKPNVVKEKQVVLRNFLAEKEMTAPQHEMSEEMKENLKSLGYLQ